MNLLLYVWHLHKNRKACKERKIVIREYSFLCIKFPLYVNLTCTKLAYVKMSTLDL